MNIAIFDDHTPKDSCVDFFPPYEFCYYIIDSTIFGMNRYCQSFYYHWTTSISRGTSRVLTAKNIGYISYVKYYYIGLSTTIDSTILVGYIDKGVLFGDSVITDISYPHDIIIKSFHLNQNYPNPFNPVTTISYQIPQSGFVSLKVYDILGREVATLVNEEKPAGNYEVKFDGNDLSSGIYFYELLAGNYTSVKKMILLR